MALFSSLHVVHRPDNFDNNSLNRSYLTDSFLITVANVCMRDRKRNRPIVHDLKLAHSKSVIPSITNVNVEQ